MWKEFKAFMLRGNVLDLAIAVVIGGAFGVVVKSLVDDVLMPPIGMALGHVDFTNLYVLLKDGPKSPPPYATLADAKAAGAVTLGYGAFLNNVLVFVVVALAVFVVMKAAMRFQKKPVAAPPDTKACPFCAMVIPLVATRCPHCTSPLP